MSRSTPLQHRLIRLEDFLLRHRDLWQPVPFHAHAQGLPLAWAANHPALEDALLALSDADTFRLENDGHALQHWLTRHLPTLQALPPLIELPASTDQLIEAPRLPRPWPTGFAWDIPGRKWAQIEAFSSAIHPLAPRFVDWCAGKGHLSRSLAFQHAHPVHALEWDSALVNAACQLRDKTCTDVTPILQDVLADSAAVHLDKDCHCVALHACGRLHLRLLSVAARQGSPAISFSPCCYHLIDARCYHPLSHVETSLLPERLSPTRDQLRLAVQETVTANGHARRLRERKSAWRLGFMAWMNAPMPVDGVALPSLADRHFHGSFADFCLQAATLADCSLDMTANVDGHEQAGWRAHARIQRLELLRHAFRRALEVWLCLDRACWLEQQGYAVEISTFCAASVTPRNILIEACRV